MNQLNSILLEGTVSENPIVTDSEHFILSSCHFPIKTERIDHKTGHKKMEKSIFTIEAWGKLAETCVSLNPNMGIRVVGRIKAKQGDDHEDLPQMFIVAEHIEIKPASKVKSI